MVYSLEFVAFKFIATQLHKYRGLIWVPRKGKQSTIQ